MPAMGARERNDGCHRGVATETAVTAATETALPDSWAAMSATPLRAQRPASANRDSLRSIRAGAVWTGLPLRERHLLEWLLAADIVSAELASLLVYRQLRTAQRRLRRLVKLGLLHGFWCAGAHRPRGRYAYALTKTTRLDVERLAWPEGRPERPPDLPSSAPIHQLATHDLLAAFLRAADPAVPEGIVAWVPERACGQLFGGLLRPDALAGIRVGDRMATLFIERDLGTERGEGLAVKIRRYGSLFARAPGAPLSVAFVVESERRARSILDVARRRAAGGAHFLVAVDERVRADPLGAGWLGGGATRSIRDLATEPAAQDLPILTPGCLADADTIEALDDRGATLLPALYPFIQST